MPRRIRRHLAGAGVAASPAPAWHRSCRSGCGLSRFVPDPIMLLPLRFWAFAAFMPSCFRGADLHRAGLQAAATGDPRLADRLFESAAVRYREELRVPDLARLRV